VPSLARPADLAVGGSLLTLGVLALSEARRLHGLRTQMVAGAVVGDDTFPLVVGVGLILLGLACLFLRPPATTPVATPAAVRTRLLASAAVLAGYAAAVPWLGYTPSTALGATALFAVMGGYRWTRAVLLGAVTTGVLHLLFRVWLRHPLPGGWLEP